MSFTIAFTVEDASQGSETIQPAGDRTGHGPPGETSAPYGMNFAMLESLPGGGDPTTWLEPVPHEQYQAANQR
jgi:hypothetical protein